MNVGFRTRSGSADSAVTRTERCRNVAPIESGPMIQRTAPEYGLAPAAYQDPGWYAMEQDALFASQWSLVGAVDDLTRPGDYLTATVGRAPLVIICSEDGVIRAFHNLCRHRGMVMLAGAGNVGSAIKCFYHQWRYSTAGPLEVVPQRKEQFPNLDLDDLGLLPASVTTWEGMVFAHPDPHATPLADLLGELPSHLGSHRPGLLRQVATAHIDAGCNWKLLIENHVDVYHLWYLHGDSLGDFDHTRFEHHQLDANWASYEPARGAVAEAALMTGTTPIRHLDQRDRNGLGAHLLFPNTMMASSAEFFATYVAHPVAPDRTRIELRIRAEEEADPAKLLRAVRSFIEEDVSACEAIQLAIASPSFTVGPLALDHEAPIAAFHHQILEAVGR